MLVKTNKELIEGRYFHGILTYLSKPLERLYFILDSKQAVLYTFSSICQDNPLETIVIA